MADSQSDRSWEFWIAFGLREILIFCAVVAFMWRPAWMHYSATLFLVGLGILTTHGSQLLWKEDVFSSDVVRLGGLITLCVSAYHSSLPPLFCGIYSLISKFEFRSITDGLCTNRWCIVRELIKFVASSATFGVVLMLNRKFHWMPVKAKLHMLSHRLPKGRMSSSLQTFLQAAPHHQQQPQPGGSQPPKDRRLAYSLLLLIFAFLAYWISLAGGRLLDVASVFLRGFTDSELLTLAQLAQSTNYSAAEPLMGGLCGNASTPREQLRIPKILHRTWRNANLSTVPNPKWEQCYSFCKKKHPEWTLILWTDITARDFIKTEYSWFLSTYDAYKYPIQRVDAMRYFILYHYGGVYMDLDVSCRRTLDELVDFTPPCAALLPLTWPTSLSNDVMLSPARHPFFHQLIHSLAPAKKWYGSPYATVFFSTGPTFVSSNFLHAAPSIRNDVLVMDQTVLEGRNREEEKNGGFFVHVVGSSWHEGDAKLIVNAAWIVTKVSEDVRVLQSVIAAVCVLGLGGYMVKRARRKREVVVRGEEGREAGWSDKIP